MKNKRLLDKIYENFEIKFNTYDINDIESFVKETEIIFYTNDTIKNNFIYIKPKNEKSLIMGNNSPKLFIFSNEKINIKFEIKDEIINTSFNIIKLENKIQDYIIKIGNFPEEKEKIIQVFKNEILTYSNGEIHKLNNKKLIEDLLIMTLKNYYFYSEENNFKTELKIAVDNDRILLIDGKQGHGKTTAIYNKLKEINKKPIFISLYNENDDDLLGIIVNNILKEMKFFEKIKRKIFFKRNNLLLPIIFSIATIFGLPSIGFNLLDLFDESIDIKDLFVILFIILSFVIGLYYQMDLILYKNQNTTSQRNLFINFIKKVKEKTNYKCQVEIVQI